MSYPRDYKPFYLPLGGSSSSIQSASGDQKVTLVFFIGGATYAEVAALRFLSQAEDGT